MQHTRVILPKFYRYFALIFFITGLALILLLSYYTLGRAEIIIIPNYQNVEIETIVDIKEVPFDSPIIEEAGVVRGKIAVLELEESKNYPALGTSELATDTVGQVVIVNHSSKDQTLVKTTRLLSPAGVLLRLKDNVVVPAGGEVTTWVYPDKPEEFTEIQPTRFVIPGLWSGLQDKIYAGNSEVLKKGAQKIKIISEDDLKQAEEDLINQLSQKAINEFNQQLAENQNFYSKLVQKEVLTKNFDGQVGDSRDNFTATIKARIAVVAFDEIKLLNLAKKKLSASLPSDKELKNFDPKDVSYTVENYDLENKLAQFKVKATGQSIIKGESQVLDKAKLAGKSKPEIIDYFSNFSEVKSVTVKFQPNWIWQAPKNPERIEVIVR